MTRFISDPKIFKAKALKWASTFRVFCYLDSNSFNDQYSKFDTLIAVGVIDEIVADAGNAFDKLAQFRTKNTDWITGFFGYDLKNEIEDLSSDHADSLKFPDLYFFAPQHLIIVRDYEVEIIATNAKYIFDCIEKQAFHSSECNSPSIKNIKSKFSKAKYLSTFKKIKAHIIRGDIYVTNFCQEFFSDHALIDPLAVFLKLNEVSPNPFTAFFKWNNNYIICASPERFLAKRGSKIISQPIKGTAKRGETAEKDEQLKKQLRNHTKELQENVMIVDIVRNDLSRSAKQGTVQTEQLFDIYSFKQVHQMISTIVCELKEGITSIQAIKNSFPMGSMTGAPKIKAIQLMEQYEKSRRGVYSGAIGYFNPDNDFDFNVVIRSLLYNQTNKYLSFHAGSAITYYADAEKEYEECLLKAKAILEALGNPDVSL